MAELNTLVGDRMEGLAAHHLPVQNLSYPSLEMFTPHQRYWQGWVKSCGAAMDLLPSFQEADLIA